MNSTQITILVMILLYMVATVVIGLIVSNRKKSKVEKQSNEDFLMAGKSLGPIVLAGTLFAANTGGASTIGVATNVYNYGLSASWYVIAPGAQKNALAQATLTFAPAVIGGVVLAAIVAATMSSASGNMIGTATMFTNDIFRPYINKGVKDDNKEVWVSRITMVFVGVVGLVIALTASNIISVMMGAFALRSAGPFAAFICGIFYKNVTQRAGFISIVVGTLVAAIWIYVLKTPWGLSAMVPGGIVAFIAIFSVSAIERKMGVKPAKELDLD